MPASTTPGQRFTQLIQQLGLTKNAFAQSLGKTATVIQHLVDERNKPGFDLLSRVLEVYPNVASDWLLLGTGPMLRDTQLPELFEPTTLAGAPIATDPVPLPGGIDLDDIPPAPRRRPGTLLQPADIAATLVLAAHGNGNGSSRNGHAPAPLVEAASVAQAAAVPVGVGPAAAPVAPAGAAPAPATPIAAVVPAAIPAASAATTATPAAPTLPDPAYLAALLQAQHLQHQLALSEQRNQHLLEQQALLKQLVEVLQRR